MIVHERSLDVHLMNELRVKLWVLDDIGVRQELFRLDDGGDGEVRIVLVNG
jgi:hypothetical protein